MKYYKIILSFFIASFISQAQKLQMMDSSNIFDEIEWDNIMDIVNQDETSSLFADEIAQLEENPLDLNKASIEELRRIPLITNLVASRIVRKRNTVPFVSVDELQNIKGITAEIFSFIHKYVKVEDEKSTRISGYFINRASTEIEKRRGFVNGSYLGSPVKTLNKLFLLADNKNSSMISSINSIEVGILAEKDAGEQKMLSFITGYGCISIPLISTRIIIGDYHVETAEGLIFWRASEFSKSGEVIAPVHKNGGGVRPHLSSDESSYFRGTALDTKISNMQFQIMYSNKYINATIDSSGKISSIDKSGLFRTKNELCKYNSAQEKMIGYRGVVYFMDGFKLGVTGYNTRLSRPLLLKETDGQSTYLFMYGIDLSFTRSNYEIFSDCAVDLSNRTALLCGIAYEPNTTLTMTLLARKYPPGFQSIYGNSFGECNGQIQNESGVYFGLRMQPLDKIYISMYYDQFKYPQFTQFIPLPSNGNDFLSVAECKISDDFILGIRFKRKDVPIALDENDSFAHLIKKLTNRVQENYRIENEFNSSLSVRFTSRIEWTNTNYGIVKKPEHGFLLSQSVKWIPAGLLNLQVRLTFFQTDSYDSRLYELEEDFPNTFSNPALFDKGMRWYLIFKYRLSSYFLIAGKYSQLIKDGVASIGSNLDEINGDTQSTISLQIDVKF